MSGEIWNSCRYVLGARDGGREIHAAGLSCCSSGMIFFYFFISKLLASKDKFGWEEALQGSRESIPPLSLSFFYMYFEVLCRVISEGGSSSALQMNAFSILVVLIKMCVFVCSKKEAALLGFLEEGAWVNQTAIAARLMRIREQEWRREERGKGGSTRRESPVFYQ